MADARAKLGVLPWLICCLGAFYFGYVYFLRVAPSVMIDQLMRDFAVNAAMLGNLAAAYYYIYAAMQIPFGIAVDNVGPRRVLIGAVLVCATGATLFAAADTLTLAFVSRLLIGAGAAAAWVGTMRLTTIWLPPERYAFMVGLTNLIAMLGGAAGQGPLALVIDSVGWRAASYAAAAVGFAIAFAFWATRWLSPTPAAAAATAGRPRIGVLPVLRLALGHRAAWAMGAYGATAAGPTLAIAVLWGVPFVMQAYGLGRPAAGAFASTILIGWGVVGPAAGWLSDRLGRRKPLLYAGPLIGLAAWPVLIYVPDLPVALLYLLAFIAGGSLSGFLVGFAVAKEFTPTAATGTITSLLNASVMISIAVLQVVIGYILDLNWTGEIENGVRLYDAETYRLGFTAIPVLLLAGLIAVRFIPETHCRQIVD